jgi:hypothetical protein
MMSFSQSARSIDHSLHATGANNGNSEPGAGWRAIVNKSGSGEFGAAFAPNAVLEGSGLNRSFVGTPAIDAFFAATARGLYDGLRFTSETVDGRKTFLEWEGSVFGKPVGGTTIVTRDATGLIQSIYLYHRPLPVVLEFSKELERRLNGKVDPNLLSAPE